MAEVVILGAGIAGLSAGRQAIKIGLDATIFEARERWGGLLDHFIIDSYRFDYAVHLAFGSDPDYIALLGLTDYNIHYPSPYNYEKGLWLKHPVQNNLYLLPVKDKVKAIKSFIERPEEDNAQNYRQWLEQQFGEVIAERFPVRYTEKYWTVPAEKMSTDWIGNRLYRPDIEEVLTGAMTDRTGDYYYLQEMYYPQKGGFSEFLEPLAKGLRIQTGKKAVLIDSQKKYIQFQDGSREYYNHLVSSIPLPDLVGMLKDCKCAVKEAASTLWATSIALVSLGLKSPQAADHLWFYIYDQEIFPARVHAPHKKASDSVPGGCSSLQFETYYSRYKPIGIMPDNLVEHVVKKGEKMKLFSGNDLTVSDYRAIEYGNVVFDHGMVKRRDSVLKYLDQIGIISIGRFGEWDYHWAEQSFLSGKKVKKISPVV